MSGGPEVDQTSYLESRYKPLPDNSFFRLFVLKPGDYEDDIDCELTSVTRSEARFKYEALSYAWHDYVPRLQKDKQIRCNKKWIEVGDNLCLAMRFLRHGSLPRILWVDQLCINQDDTDERNMQVQSMSLVYSQAKQTVIWLGFGVETRKNQRNVIQNVCHLVNG